MHSKQSGPVQILYIQSSPVRKSFETGFAKRGLMHTIINILKYHFEIFNSLYLKNAQSSLCAFLH